MGFIEDLRRKKSNELELRRQQALISEEAIRVKREKEEVEKKRVQDLEEKARKFFQESGLGEMLEETAKLIEGKVNFYPHEGSYKSWLTISRVERGSMVETVFVDIEADSEGVIRFNAGPSGSSAISQSVWKDNRNVLEAALGKAYLNPKVSIYERADVDISKEYQAGAGL